MASALILQQRSQSKLFKEKSEDKKSMTSSPQLITTQQTETRSKQVKSSVPLFTTRGIQYSRIQSPSSILTYKQCPRKYYYNYIESLPTQPSIHLTRGKIAHAVLENFFKLDINKIPPPNAEFVLKIFIQDMFKQEWTKAGNELNSLNMDATMLDYYFYETKDMLQRWYVNFMQNVSVEMQRFSFTDAFKRLTPQTEMKYSSPSYGVQGFVDAIHHTDEGAIVIDYKTSKEKKFTDAYKLQLALYCLMYEEKHNALPVKAGIYFLKHGEQLIQPVDRSWVDLAKLEAELIHINTATKEINDYPKKPGPLCKWKTGQCDFYGKCFGVSKFS